MADSAQMLKMIGTGSKRVGRGQPRRNVMEEFGGGKKLMPLPPVGRFKTPQNSAKKFPPQYHAAGKGRTQRGGGFVGDLLEGAFGLIPGLGTVAAPMVGSLAHKLGLGRKKKASGKGKRSRN